MGRSGGGSTTKIRVLADAPGRPLRFILTGGQANDCTQAGRLLGDSGTGCVVADEGYGTDRVLAKIEGLGAIAVVAPKSDREVQREYDRELYKRRNPVEGAFNKPKRFRRIAPPVTTGRPRTSELSCTWRLRFYGFDPIVDSS